MAGLFSGGLGLLNGARWRVYLAELGPTLLSLLEYTAAIRNLYVPPAN